MGIRSVVAGKHILVTGGAGFIGSHLVDLLIAEHAAHVTVVDDFFRAVNPTWLTRARACPACAFCGWTRPMSAPFAMRSRDSTPWTWSLISPSSPCQRHWRSPSGASIPTCSSRRRCVKCCGRAASLPLCISLRQRPMARRTRWQWTNRIPLEPLTPYAASKAASDHRAHVCRDIWRRCAGRPALQQLRAAPERPGGAGVIPTLLHCVFEQRPFAIFGDGEQTRDYIYVTDTVRAVVDLYGCPAARGGRVVNVGSGTEISILELVERLERIVRARVPIEHRPSRPGDVRRHRADVTLLRDLVGFEPQVRIDDGLASQTVAFYRERAVSRVEIG